VTRVIVKRELHDVENQHPPRSGETEHARGGGGKVAAAAAAASASAVAAAATMAASAVGP
jgi:hypothetical protein